MNKAAPAKIFPQQFIFYLILINISIIIMMAFLFQFFILSIFLTGYWLRGTIPGNIVKNSAETIKEELQFDLFHYAQGKI